MSVFGERLRELRMRADMSQETVAVLLGVSAQAVSKWENGKNYPDIPSLISLASLFHVSVDELLGNKNRIHDLETAWRSILKTADERKKLDFLKEAVSEYPGHSMFKYKLACEEYFVAENESDPGKRIQLLTLADEHFSAVRKENPDFISAIDMHVRVLAALGREDEAAKLAETSPNYDRLLLLVLEGEELIDQKRKLAALSLMNLYADLIRINSVEAAEKAKALITDVASGEEQFFSLLLDAYYYQALLFCDGKNYDAAVSALKAERQLAESYDDTDSSDRTFFYPLLPTKSKDEIRTQFQKHILDERFSCLRGREDYNELMK